MREEWSDRQTKAGRILGGHPKRKAGRQTGQEASVHPSRKQQAGAGGTDGTVSGERRQVASVAELYAGMPWVLN